jgi:Protein of unknown function (DUF1579)
MRQTSWLATAVLVVLTARTRADENPFAAIEKASKPGPEHKLLEPLAGQWTYRAKLWMQPGGEPMVMKGVCTRKWILDGRFLHETVENTAPTADFKGIGWTGYDNAQKKYVGSWINSMGSGISRSTGTADRNGKGFTFEREHFCPLASQLLKGRDVIRIRSNDSHVTEMYHTGPDGKEMKTREIEYTRKK